jgi:hypothetical protein
MFAMQYRWPGGGGGGGGDRRGRGGEVAFAEDVGLLADVACCRAADGGVIGDGHFLEGLLKIPQLVQGDRTILLDFFRLVLRVRTIASCTYCCG